MKKLLTVLLIALAAIAAISAQVPTDSIGKKIWKGAVNINCNFEPAASSSSFNNPEEKQAFRDLFSSEDFYNGSVATEIVIINLGDHTVAGLERDLREAGLISFPAQAGALAQLNLNLYGHYDEGESWSFTDNFDDLIRIISVGNPDEKLGVCRHYAFLTSKIAIEAFDLRASAVSGYSHVISQVRVPGEDRLVLIDNGLIITDLNGLPLDSKDRIDAVIATRIGQFAPADVTIDPERNAIVYFNRYNNFAGLWSQLQNWNIDDRQNDFFFDRQDLSLFSHINSKGALYGTIERKHWGLEGYYLLDNNKYSHFLKGMQGLNLAGNLPFSSKNNRWKENIFVNLGGYRTKLFVQSGESENQSLQNTYGLQISLNDYLEYSLTPHLAMGAIGVLNINREIAREGAPIHGDYDSYWFVSPFVSYSLPGKHLKLVAGTHLTNTLSLPNLWKLTYIPWAQALWQKKDFSSSLRCEYQPASWRIDNVSSWRFDFGQVEVRTFAEKYTADFKETNLYHDALGTEIGLVRRIKGIGVSLSVTGLTDNCGNKNVFLNLGVKF